jgi:hypothetical protein
MTLEINKREAALLLAALRNWQDESASTNLADLYEGYFEEHEPLSSQEIDELCARIAEASAAISAFLSENDPV